MEQKLRPWRIKKGRFSANPLLRLWHALPRWAGKKTRWEFEFELGKDAWWYPAPGKADHIQKIAGVSFGLDHHKNSMRLGFVPAAQQNRFHLYIYAYVDGAPPGPLSTALQSSRYLGTVEGGLPYPVSIDTWMDQVNIRVALIRGMEVTEQSAPIKALKLRGNRLVSAWPFYRLLSPYIEFGPGEGAPQGMTIYLSKIKSL